jgi:hypothetical protein
LDKMAAFLIPTLIVGGLYLASKAKEQAAALVTPKAGGSLGNPNVNNLSSSTPVPTPSANSPAATPPFYQQKNAATPSEPVTSESFDPIDLTKIESGTQDRQGKLVGIPFKAPTVHNTRILNNTFNEKLAAIQRPISAKFTNPTELSSVGHEQEYAYGEGNGTPDNAHVDTSIVWGAPNLRNSGGSQGTHPTIVHAGNVQYAHRLAPSNPRQTSVEKTSKQVAKEVLKSSYAPAKPTTEVRPSHFTPIKQVYGA